MAIVDNKADFDDKIVMDVGAGSGILSLFSAQVRGDDLGAAWFVRLLTQTWCPGMLATASAQSGRWSGH